MGSRYMVVGILFYEVFLRLSKGWFVFSEIRPKIFVEWSSFALDQEYHSKFLKLCKCTYYFCENSLIYLFCFVFFNVVSSVWLFTGHHFMFYIFTQSTQLNTALYLSGLMAAILSKNQLSGFTGDLSKLCAQILQKIKIEAKFIYVTKGPVVVKGC